MKRKLTRRIVQSDLSDNSTFYDGITTPYGFTAGGKFHLGGNNMGAIGTHRVSTRHRSPVTRHQSASPGTGQPGTGPGTGQPGTGQSTTGQPGTGLPGTGQPGTGHLIPGTSHRSLLTGHIK